MNNQVQFQYLKKWILFLVIFWLGSWAEASSPLLRVKTGFSSLAMNAGQNVVNQPLNSMVTFQPSILWDFSELSSRLGVHYLQELGGNYGVTPVSGIGFSGYYYLFGISTLNTVTADGTVIQKSRPGPYIIASVTPVNINLNHFEEADTSKNFNVSGFIYDVSAGLGYDYPISRNLILSIEYMIRNGIGGESKASDGSIGYKGSTIFLSFATSYF